MKKSIIAFLCILMTLLCGCSDLNMGSDSLLYAPALNKEQSDIYKVLIDSVGKNIKLKYPKSGDKRSAFLIANIDDEPTAEAVVFYQKDNAAEKDTSVRVNILDKIKDKWVSVYDLNGEGKDIDKVVISNINNIGKTVFIGYATVNKNFNLMYAYKYSSKRLQALFNMPYNYFDIVDFNGNGSNDIFTISNEDDQKVSQANLYAVNDKKQIYQKSKVALSTSYSNYVNITTGICDNNCKDIILDSINDKNNLGTEVVLSANNELYNPMYQFRYDLYEETLRPDGYYSMDFNQDGIVEIPVTSPFIGYEKQPDEEKAYMTDWYVFNRFYSFKKKYSSYYNRNDAYVFVLPGRWTGLVTVKKDPITDEVVFYKYNKSLDNSTTELMRIKATERKNSQKYISEGYKLVNSKGQIDYFVKVAKGNDEKLNPTDAEIMNSFYVL